MFLGGRRIVQLSANEDKDKQSKEHKYENTYQSANIVAAIFLEPAILLTIVAEMVLVPAIRFLKTSPEWIKNSGWLL